ncbi:hypothetical protein GOODEAATRI_000427 [Goodea atripinnis]|uniref:Inositol polyphosphate-related phosphatase domain-containing protein n=1 Tax=Goodea atripinnis TaxID=208336 RepID=A0ABV0PJK6_9TELE
MVCFLNCHLAAHMHNALQRVDEFEHILETQDFDIFDTPRVLDHKSVCLHIILLPSNPTLNYRFLCKLESESLVVLPRVVFWFGDLNFRIEDHGLHFVRSSINGGRLNLLWSKDQEFEEGPLNFKPTYKFDRKADTYDTSGKKRKPAWTDRILWRIKPKSLPSGEEEEEEEEGDDEKASTFTDNGQDEYPILVTQNTYTSVMSYGVSDHKPVIGNFTLEVRTEEEPVPLAFFARGEAEVVSSLGSCVKALGVETEQVLPVVYQPQAVFRVRAVTRCTSTLQGHTEAVISTAFSPTGKYLASSSKDGSVRIWDTVLGRYDKILTGHTQSVTCVKWGGDGLLYTSSQDRTVKVWRPKDVRLFSCLTFCESITEGPDVIVCCFQGVLCRTLQGHAHWVNTLALSTDYVLRTGAFEPATATINPQDLTGSCTTWYLMSLRGHVGSVYQVAWSADSRLLVSGSSDSTLKVWDVYAVDWSPDGQRPLISSAVSTTSYTFLIIRRSQSPIVPI